MTGRQRLGVQDALWLEMDRPGNLMVVDSLFWTDEPIDWDAYRETNKERLWDRYPVFRSVAVRGEDNAWYWEEQEGADLDARYEHVTLPEPGGDAELQELIAAYRVLPLDRSEPLWRAVLVDNFHGGSAVLFRGHHAIADGIRMVQLALSIFDSDPGGTAAHPRNVSGPVVPEPAPSPPRSPLGRVASQLVDVAAASTELARGAVTNPVGAAHTGLVLSRSALGAVPGDIDTVRKLAIGTRNDASIWTGPVGERKAIAWAPPLALDEVKQVARAHSATVNDVLVTCVARSLGAYLQKHQAVCDSVTWDVPVNLKPFDPDLPVTLGNAFAIVQLELPTNHDDPLRTLDAVRHRMARIKRGHEALIDFGIQAAISRMSKWMYRMAVDLLASRAVGVLTNVPGPQIPLYLAGQKVVGMIGWAPVTADQVMSFTIFSYDGQVFVGIAADAGQVPEPQLIVDGFHEAFRSLSLRSR